MRVLLATDQYTPEARSISYMLQELAEGLVERGHDVTVVASYARPNLTSASSAGRRPLDFTTESGVKVIRVDTLHYKTRSYILRGLGELLLPFLFIKKARKFIDGSIDVVVVYTPPLMLTVFGTMAKHYFKARYVLNVQDIFPQNAIDLGLLRNGLIVRLLHLIEASAYRSADRLTAHSPNNAKFLVEKKNVPAEKIRTVHNWVDIVPYREARDTGEFRRRYNLEGKFVILFAGIFGPSQNLDFVIRAAEQVRDIDDLCFLFVGGGSEKNKLVQLVERLKLTNVRFEPFVGRDDYPALAKEANVGLACLSPRNHTPVFPGKIVGFMASGVPIVAFLNRESDGHQMIRNAGCGYSIVSEDPCEAGRLIRQMYNERDRLPEMGRRGVEYASIHFAKQRCIDALEDVICSADTRLAASAVVTR